MWVLVAEQRDYRTVSLGMGVWGMVRGLSAMWELEVSKVSSSVIVTVWLAQIGRAAVSTWLPCSSPHHGTEQSCTSAPTHQTCSGVRTVLGSRRVAHADTRPWVQRFGKKGKRAWLWVWCDSTKHAFFLLSWKDLERSCLWWINSARKAKKKEKKKEREQ